LQDFTKLVAHLKTEIRVNYQPFLDLVLPKLKLVVDEIRHLEKARGRDFPSLGV